MTNACSPSFDLIANKGVTAFARARLQPFRLDFLSSRRHLVDDRQIKIAKYSQRKRARNRRGTHHQNMRMKSFGTNRRALLHAKAMLFIDDRKRKRIEFDGFLN